MCRGAQRGRADIGIIPAITYATIPGLVILPDAAIAAKAAVRSILLVSHKPIDQVNTIAADTSSRSSVALARILCQKLWGRERQFRDFPPDLDAMLAACDAALLIGDPALRVERPNYFVYDLAEEWRHFTGKPFVFAFWAVRLQALSEIRRSLDVASVFRNSRDHGIQPAEHRADRAPLECARRPERAGGDGLPHRQHPLLSRRRKPGRAGTLLPLLGGVRRH